MNSTLGKLLYGALFTVALPVLLVVWAIETRGLVKLPAIHSVPWGIGTVAAGSLLVALGMASLWWVGGGLPMNAFPPPRYVSSGIYSLFSHPIYLGFALVCIGAAITAGSASGLWLVSTTVVLASAALVLGYELPDLQGRFGRACPEQRLLPLDDESPPSGMERLRCYLTVLLPWFLIYEVFVVLGVPPDAKIAYLPFESRLPVLPWTQIFYGSVYVMVLLVPVLARTRHDLRLFSSRALLAMVIVFPLSSPCRSSLRLVRLLRPDSGETSSIWIARRTAPRGLPFLPCGLGIYRRRDFGALFLAKAAVAKLGRAGIGQLHHCGNACAGGCNCRLSGGRRSHSNGSVW